MPLILALDTTADPGSIALADGPSLIEEVVLTAPDGYGDVLFIEIERLLTRHLRTLRDIDCFASATGPGTFTGVRAGLTAAKGLAHAAASKVVGVSNLQALAWFSSADVRAPFLDARRGEVYGAVYDAHLRLVQDEVVMPHESWLATLPSAALPFTQNHPLARAIAAIASHCPPQDPSTLEANYVRPWRTH